MGLEIINKKVQVDTDELNESKDYLKISNLIIPFSAIFKNNPPPGIYSGEESILFKEKDSQFQQILIYEFLSD